MLYTVFTNRDDGGLGQMYEAFVEDVEGGRKVALSGPIGPTQTVPVDNDLRAVALAFKAQVGDNFCSMMPAPGSIRHYKRRKKEGKV